jgi:hypothetical protein
MRHTGRSRTGFAGWNGIVLAALFGVAVLSQPALAKPKGGSAKRIAVLPPTDGTPKDAVITAKIAAALKKQKVHPLTGGALKKAVAAGLPSSDADWVLLARKLRVDGILEPVVSAGARGKRRVEVVVHNGLDGATVGREDFSAKGPPSKLAAAAGAGLWRKLGSAILGTQPAKKDAGPAVAQAPGPAAQGVGAGERSEALAREPAETPAPGDEKDEATSEAKPTASKDAEAEGETEASDEPGAEGKSGEHQAAKAKRKPRILEVEIGNRFLQRAFSFTPSSAGASYNEHFSLVPQGRVAWFPITYAGIFFAGEFNPALSTGSNPSYPTYARELLLGAQARYPLSVGAIGIGVGYFHHIFMMGDPSDPNSPRRRELVWPNVAYRGLRVAASGRFHLWSIVGIGAEVAYRLVTSPGDGNVWVRSSHYFPNATVNYGLDGSFFLGAGVLPWLEIRGGVDYRRYGFGALVPGSNNANGTNATGATDQYLGFTLGVVGVYGGR